MKHIPSQYLTLGTTKVGNEAYTLGNIFRRHGWYKQAMVLYERVLIECEKALGFDHPDTLYIVSNMASIRRNFTCSGGRNICVSVLRASDELIELLRRAALPYIYSSQLEDI